MHTYARLSSSGPRMLAAPCLAASVPTAARIKATRVECASASALRVSGVRTPGHVQRLAGASRRSSVRVCAIQAGTRVLRKALTQQGSVFVAGATGQLAIRIVRELLLIGVKVTAGVSDLDEGVAVFDFAKRYGLIDRTQAAALKLVEVDFSDSESLQANIPRGSRVVIVEGDSVDRKKVDSKVIVALAAELADLKPSSVLLVSAGAGGGGGFGLLGGGGASGLKFSRAEQAVAESGVAYSIVRAFGVDKTDDAFGELANVAIGPLGTFPAASLSSRAQVASVVAEVLRQGSGSYALEVAAAPDYPEEPVEQLVAQAIASADAERAEAAAVEETEAAAAALEVAAAVAPALSKSGFFGFGSKKVAAPVEEEPEEVLEEAPKKPAFSFAFGRPKQAKPEPEEEEEDEEAPVPKRGGLFSFVQKKAAKDEEEEEEEAPAPKRGGLFAFGAKKAAVEEEEEEPAPKRGGLFAFGAKKTTEEEEEEEAPTRGGFFAFGAKKAAADEEEKPRGRGTQGKKAGGTKSSGPRYVTLGGR